MRRMFAADPPRIVFTKDFLQRGHGDLLPGRTVTLVYDAERLPQERPVDGGHALAIDAMYRTSAGGAIATLRLWSQTGRTLSKTGVEPGEGTMVIGRIELPEDAQFLEVWFVNKGASGAEYWDSNFGRNYLFRFVADELHVTRAEVTHEAGEPLGRLEVDIAAVADIDAIYVAYHIANAPAASRRHEVLALARTGTTSGELQDWSGAVAVSEDAVVRLTFRYAVDGSEHTDTNSGRGYVIWPGSTRNPEFGVL